MRAKLDKGKSERDHDRTKETLKMVRTSSKEVVMKTTFVVISLSAMLMCNCISARGTESSALDGLEDGTKAALLYLPNRLLDLVDIFRANIGVGRGWGLNLRATRFLTGAASEYDTIRFGMRGREMPRYEEYVDECCLGLMGLELGHFDRSSFEVGATAHLGYIGAEAGFDLDETVDFLLGFACIDYREDDFGSRVW